MDSKKKYILDPTHPITHLTKIRLSELSYKYFDIDPTLTPSKQPFHTVQELSDFVDMAMDMAYKQGCFDTQNKIASVAMEVNCETGDIDYRDITRGSDG